MKLCIACIHVHMYEPLMCSGSPPPVTKCFNDSKTRSDQPDFNYWLGSRPSQNYEQHTTYDIMDKHKRYLIYMVLYYLTHVCIYIYVCMYACTINEMLKKLIPNLDTLETRHSGTFNERESSVSTEGLGCDLRLYAASFHFFHWTTETATLSYTCIYLWAFMTEWG